MDQVHLAFGDELEKLAKARSEAARIARLAAPFVAKRIRGITRTKRTLGKVRRPRRARRRRR